MIVGGCKILRKQVIATPQDTSEGVEGISNLGRHSAVNLKLIQHFCYIEQLLQIKRISCRGEGQLNSEL